MSASERAVVVMGKVPRPGRVKTRMTPALSPKVASELYAAFLEDVFRIVDRVAEVMEIERIFSCALGPDDAEGQARGLCPEGWRFVVQRGEGLGDRIANAREDAAAEKVVIIGSDAPTMPGVRILEAFRALEEAPAVLGPTLDGGYYLIGLAGPQPMLLREIPWSTERVMEETRARARAAGVAIAELAAGYDIDQVEDLLQAREDAERFGAACTARALARIAPAQ